MAWGDPTSLKFDVSEISSMRKQIQTTSADLAKFKTELLEEIVLSLVSQYGVFFIGAIISIKTGNIAPSVILLFVQLMNYIINPLMQIPTILSKRLACKPLFKKISEIIQIETENTEGELIENINSNQIVPTVKNCKTVIDKSVESCNLQDFEKSYIKNTMQSDIIKVLKSFDDENKSIPMHIIDYKEEDTSRT